MKSLSKLDYAWNILENIICYYSFLIYFYIFLCALNAILETTEKTWIKYKR